jgi:hypothetical protein
MRNVQLECLLRDRERNIQMMANWSWKKTSRHIDLINQQLGMAWKQKNDDAMDFLEEFWSQVVEARYRKLLAES